MRSTMGGNQRSENVTAKTPPGFSTRATSAKTSSGLLRYSTEIFQMTASNDPVSNGTPGLALRSCTH